MRKHHWELQTIKIIERISRIEDVQGYSHSGTNSPQQVSTGRHVTQRHQLTSTGHHVTQWHQRTDGTWHNGIAWQVADTHRAQDDAGGGNAAADTNERNIALPAMWTSRPPPPARRRLLSSAAQPCAAMGLPRQSGERKKRDGQAVVCNQTRFDLDLKGHQNRPPFIKLSSHSKTRHLANVAGGTRPAISVDEFFFAHLLSCTWKSVCTKTRTAMAHL